jgi:plastocyanin
MPTRRFLLAAVLALALAACAGEPAADTPTESGASATVAIDTFAYEPGTITVPVGTTVTWTNEDATRHTVTAGSEDAPDPERCGQAGGEQDDAVSTTFDEPGTVAYYCVLHPFMTGEVVVEG